MDAIYSTTRGRGHKEPSDTWGGLGLGGEWKDQKIRLWGFSQENGVSNFVRERVLAGGDYRLGIRDRATGQGLATIRTVSIDGTITTVAGNGTAGYSGDEGRATAAQLNVPAAVAVDAAHNLFSPAEHTKLWASRCRTDLMRLRGKQ